MDPRTRYDDPQETLLVAINGRLGDVWTAMPAIVQDYDATAGTVSAVCAIQSLVTTPGVNGQPDTTKAVTREIMLDVPVIYPRGGGVTLTFPIAAGDECLVVFASRCIDSWHYNGGVQPPNRLRMHDPSDGFAIFGPFSAPQMISNVSTDTVQLRSNDGSTFIELDPDGQIVNIDAPGGINIKGNVNITGALAVSQTIEAQGTIKSDTDVLSQTVSGHGHVHAGVQSGGSSTAPPTP